MTKQKIRREKKYSEIPTGRIRGEDLKLAEGEVYTFLMKDENLIEQKTVRKRMRLAKCYPHHAVFESEKGIMRSFQYWDIQKMLMDGTMK